jgi:hypothetical protein
VSRADQYNVTVAIDGVDDGTWDKMTGGEVDSEETKYKPGGMATAISLGGSQNVGNLTVSKLLKLAEVPKIKGWMQRAGKASVVVTKQSLDVDGNVFSGAVIVYKGKLKAVTPPDVDSESSDPALVEIEVSTDGTVA